MATQSRIALTAEFTLRVVLYPAPDLVGQWIAHGLETDIVTQGDSPEHALAMMADALETLGRHQAGRRHASVRLRPAPAEVWKLADRAKPIGLSARVERVKGRRGLPGALASGPWTLYALVSEKPPVPPRAR